MSFIIFILTIALNHTVAVIAHIAEELNRKTRRLGVQPANTTCIWRSDKMLLVVYSFGGGGGGGFTHIIMSFMSLKAIIFSGPFSYLVIMSLAVRQPLSLIVAMAKERFLTLGAHKML